MKKELLQHLAEWVLYAAHTYMLAVERRQQAFVPAEQLGGTAAA